MVHPACPRVRNDIRHSPTQRWEGSTGPDGKEGRVRGRGDAGSGAYSEEYVWLEAVTRADRVPFATDLTGSHHTRGNRHTAIGAAQGHGKHYCPAHVHVLPAPFQSGGHALDTGEPWPVGSTGDAGLLPSQQSPACITQRGRGEASKSSTYEVKRDAHRHLRRASSSVPPPSHTATRRRWRGGVLSARGRFRRSRSPPCSSCP